MNTPIINRKPQPSAKPSASSPTVAAAPVVPSGQTEEQFRAAYRRGAADFQLHTLPGRIASARTEASVAAWSEVAALLGGAMNEITGSGAVPDAQRKLIGALLALATRRTATATAAARKGIEG